MAVQPRIGYQKWGPLSETAYCDQSQVISLHMKAAEEFDVFYLWNPESLETPTR